MFVGKSSHVRLKSTVAPITRFLQLGDRHPYIPAVPHGLDEAVGARALCVRGRAEIVTEAELDAAAPLPDRFRLGPTSGDRMRSSQAKARLRQALASLEHARAVLDVLRAHAAAMQAEGRIITRSSLARYSGHHSDYLVRLLRKYPGWVADLGIDPGADGNVIRGRAVLMRTLDRLRAAATAIRGRGELVTVAGLARESGTHEGHLRENLARRGKLAKYRDELIGGDTT